MRSRQRRSVPQRRRFFLGCEGEGEFGYGAALARLLDEQACHVHLDTKLLQPGAGDPLALIERAVSKIAVEERKFGRYVEKIILLDRDRIGQAPARDKAGIPLAAAHNIMLLWQDPCHEAFLLRHLEGFHTHRPPTVTAAMQVLQRQWPAYEKPMTAARLAERIDHAALRRAATVEPRLAMILGALGFE
jgi:hypothetical protein